MDRGLETLNFYNKLTALSRKEIEARPTLDSVLPTTYYESKSTHHRLSIFESYYTQDDALEPLSMSWMCPGGNNARSASIVNLLCPLALLDRLELGPNAQETLRPIEHE